MLRRPLQKVTLEQSSWKNTAPATPAEAGIEAVEAESRASGCSDRCALGHKPLPREPGTEESAWWDLQAKPRTCRSLRGGAVLNCADENRSQKSVSILCEGGQEAIKQTSCGWCGRHDDGHSQTRQTGAQKEGTRSGGNSATESYRTKAACFSTLEIRRGHREQ